MSIKIITNNSRVLNHINDMGYDAIFVEGHAKNVIEACYGWVNNGWGLASDPLAGYFSRPNPFHTIFIQKNKTEAVKGNDLLRLKRTMDQWDRYDNIIPMTERLWKDYEELDYSISESTLNSLLKNPVFYNCV